MATMDPALRRNRPRTWRRACGLTDQHVGGQVIVVVQQDVGLDAALGAAERGPGKQTEAQTDGGRIERQQFVLETERVCARAELAPGPEPVCHRPEQVLEDRGGAMHVGVGQAGRARPPGDPEMHQLPHAAGEAVADLTERVGMSQLTEQHGGELRPAGEPFGVALALMGVHQSGELVARHFVKQLTEQTGALYHAIALRNVWSEPRPMSPNSPTRTEGFINLTFWKAI